VSWLAGQAKIRIIVEAVPPDRNILKAIVNELNVNSKYIDILKDRRDIFVAGG
jgi:hypothetical protein